MPQLLPAQGVRVTNRRRPRHGWRLLVCSLVVGLRAMAAGPAIAQVPLAPEPPSAADATVLRQEALLEDLQRQIDELRAVSGPVPARPKPGGAATTFPGRGETPSLKLSGQVQGDMVYFSQPPPGHDVLGDLQDGSQFRRLRLVARGKTWKQLEYALGVDFALADRPAFIDNFVQFDDVPWVRNVRVGHFFEPFSLERVTQNRNNTFMERSLVDTFAPARNMGVMAFGWADDERSTWQIGTFRTNSDNIGNDTFESGQALTMRRTWLPFWDDATDGRSYLHLGAAYSFRATDEGRVRFRNTPEIRKAQPRDQPTANLTTPPFAPIFVDTGFIPARNFQLFDPEFALVLGPLSLQSEYAFAVVDQIGGPQLFFNGYMAQASWFLTGEHRPYDRHAGVHTWMDVDEEFFLVRQGRRVAYGLGAWELAARYSNIVLNDKNIQGNNLTDFTVGLNWYLNKYTRMKFNYIRAFLEDSAAANTQTDIWGGRFDVEF